MIHNMAKTPMMIVDSLFSYCVDYRIITLFPDFQGTLFNWLWKATGTDFFGLTYPTER